MINRAQLKLPDAERDHIQGVIDAPIALLEYGDYECAFCGEVQPIVREIQRRLGDDLCFAFRHFPLTNVHPHAEYAAALGLDETRLIQEVISGAYAGRIREDFKSGVRAGVNGTPCFFINGKRYDGSRALESLLAAVSQPATII